MHTAGVGTWIIKNTISQRELASDDVFIFLVLASDDVVEV